MKCQLLGIFCKTQNGICFKVFQLKLKLECVECPLSTPLINVNISVTIRGNRDIHE
jgi:hypothetical protein